MFSKRTCLSALAAILFVNLVFLIDAAEAQGLGEVVARQGSWELRRSKDSFSDKSSCVITVTGKPYIQVSPGSIFFSYRGRGGVEGYQYRIDDAPASSMQLPTNIEKQIAAIELKGAVFERILKSNRLRVQTLTLVAGIQNDDVSLVGLEPLYRRMRGLCPGG